jgi:hypothetical protein
MKHSHFFYHLYCINMACSGSVLGTIEEIRLALTPENLTDTHWCPQCGVQLVTAIDIEIRQILAEARIQLCR